MKLVSFSVQNYRSITTAHKIKVGRSTVIVGPNNEGKSNVIRGLITAMRILRSGARPMRHPLRPGHVLPARLPLSLFRPSLYEIYDWENDYPVSLQEGQPEGESVFILEFELDADEIREFREETGSHSNGTLPIRLAVGRQRVVLTISKRGRGAKALSFKSGAIASFIVQRVQFEYIEAVRTLGPPRG